MECPHCRKGDLYYTASLPGLRCQLCDKAFIDTTVADGPQRWLNWLLNTILEEYMTEEMREPYVAKERVIYERLQRERDERGNGVRRGPEGAEEGD